MVHQPIRKTGLLLSFFIHLSIALYLLLPRASSSKPATPPVKPDYEVNILQKSPRLRMISEGESADLPRTSDGTSLATEKCKGEFYTGIGLNLTPRGTVVSVALGGPAALAGVQEDDVLLNAGEIITENLKPGETVNVSLRRHGVEMSLVMKVTRVCNDII